eukprot:9471134-Pyramimonas_sp.AAC.1
MAPHARSRRPQPPARGGLVDLLARGGPPGGAGVASLEQGPTPYVFKRDSPSQKCSKNISWKPQK